MSKPDLKGMPLAEAVQQFMDGEEWDDEIEISEDRTSSRVATGINIDDHPHSLFIEMEEPAERLFVYFYSPYKVPPRRVGDMGRVLNRINHQLILGRLSCADDDDANPVQFKYGITVAGSSLTAQQVADAVQVGISTFQFWGGLLSAVALTKRPVEDLWTEALAEMEAAEKAEEEDGPSEL